MACGVGVGGCAVGGRDGTGETVALGSGETVRVADGAMGKRVGEGAGPAHDARVRQATPDPASRRSMGPECRTCLARPESIMGPSYPTPERASRFKLVSLEEKLLGGRHGQHGERQQSGIPHAGTAQPFAEGSHLSRLLR